MPEIAALQPAVSISGMRLCIIIWSFWLRSDGRMLSHIKGHTQNVSNLGGIVAHLLYM